MNRTDTTTTTHLTPDESRWAHSRLRAAVSAILARFPRLAPRRVANMVRARGDVVEAHGRYLDLDEIREEGPR